MLPSNDASMTDASSTREDEGPCICATCPFTDLCSHEAEAACVRASEEATGDDAIKARKERDL